MRPARVDGAPGTTKACTWQASIDRRALLGDVAERFTADPRDVSPSEVTEARALLASIRHYDDALAPIRSLRVDWRGPLAQESDVPPEPRFVDEGA